MDRQLVTKFPPKRLNSSVKLLIKKPSGLFEVSLEFLRELPESFVDAVSGEGITCIDTLMGVSMYYKLGCGLGVITY